MGKIVEQQAKKLSISVSKIIYNYDELNTYVFCNNEVAIEFTSPLSCLKNIKVLASKGVNIVCGTTGWLDYIDQVKQLVSKNRIGFIYASNFSRGMNIFWRIIDAASLIINKFSEYNIMGHEIHHKDKKDTPSGTALITAQILINNIKRKKRISTCSIKKTIHNDEIHISSSRNGSTVGTHQFLFDSANDVIRISHSSKCRTSYAQGAIQCAQWIKDKKGFYNIDHFFREIMNE